VLFAGTHRAGKSTLVARLALDAGAEVFCDDVLPIDAKGQAIALGMAPRLRLPAIPTLNGRIEPRIVLADERYAYLRPVRHAEHGTVAKPGVLIALDRRPASGPPRLHQMPKDVAIRLILRQTLTATHDPESAMLRAEALLAEMTCVTLRYDDLEAAVALLAAQFGDATRIHTQNVLAPDLVVPEPALHPVRPDLRLMRRPDAHVRTQEHGVFLWHLDSPMLWHLNPMGRIIWSILEDPHTPHEIAHLLSEVFDNVEPVQILADVTQFLGAALEQRLVQPC
jgi:hypothetical protein